MVKVVTRLAVAMVPVTAAALVAGCLSGNPSYFPYLLPGGPAIPTHARPAGNGYFADFDPHACRVVLRPEVCTARVRGAQVFIATVYDADGVPRRKRRVEWMLEGPGSIIEVDESGYLPGRGMKLDNRYAFSHTDYFEHCISRGGVEFNIGPGQTWCVVGSAVEGETTVIAYVPAIADWDSSRAYGKITWTSFDLHYPPAISARAGTECTLGTKLTKGGDGYRIRYRIVDGPPAALFSARGQPVGSVTEAVTAVGQDGLGKIGISQPSPTAGTNRIAIEVIKPNPDSPGEYSVVSTGETKVTWQAPQLRVTVNSPKTLALNQDVTVTYAVADTGDVDAGAVTVTARVPDGMQLIRTEPHAAVDGDTIIWTLPAAAGGKPRTVQAVYRPARVGSATLTANARTEDGVSTAGSAPVQVTEAKLLLVVDGPKAAIVGETLAFRLRVTNTGDGPADQVRVQARLADGLEVAGKGSTVEELIASLPPGQTKSIPLSVTASKGGKRTVEASAAGEGGLVALPQSAVVDVQDAQLALTAHGSPLGYVGQEVSWQLVVRNTGQASLDRVVIRATLPPEVRFVKATDGGRLTEAKGTGRQVVWDLGTAPARQERTVAVTVVCDRAVARAVLSGTVSAVPMVDRDGSARPVAPAKPIGPEKPAEAVLEIVGVPALQMSVRDAVDPLGVGQRTTYEIRVKNAGTEAATRVAVSAEVPTLMRPTRATGPTAQGTIDGQRVTFPPLSSVAPGAEATFVVEVEGLVPGDARFRADVRSAESSQPLRAEEPTRILGRESRTPGP